MKLFFESTSEYDARKDAIVDRMTMGRLGRKCMNFATKFLSDYNINAEVKYLGYSSDHINEYVKDGDELQFYKCKAEVPRHEIIDKLFNGKELWEPDCKVKKDRRYNIFYKKVPSHNNFYKVANGDEYMFVEVSPLAEDDMLSLYFNLWVRMDRDNGQFERDTSSKRWKRFVYNITGKENN